jgi:hypothetical protein
LNSSTESRKLLPRYLLGELSTEELAKIDEKYLFDDSFADALEEARRDLLDSLAAGELRGNEQAVLDFGSGGRRSLCRDLGVFC